jgi:hypothetical protein
VKSTHPLFFFVLFAIETTEARTSYVQPDGTGDAITTQAASDLASAGDSLLIAPGSHREAVTIDVSLTITSVGGPR